MAIEDMIKRIMDEAKAENQVTLAEARMKAQEFKERSQRELEREIDELEKKFKRERVNTRNIYISDGKRKARQAILSAKEELIMDAICAIRDRIKGLDEHELEEYLLPMISKTREILGDGMKVYPIREIDRKVISRHVSVEDIFSKTKDSDGSLSRFSNVDLLGGYIARSAEGSRVVDMSFQGMMERNEERIRETVARTLFGDL